MSSPKTQSAITNTVELLPELSPGGGGRSIVVFYFEDDKGENQFVDFSKYFSRAAHADSWYFTIRLTSLIQSTNRTLLSLLSLNIS